MNCSTCGGHHLSTHEMCPNMTAHDNRFWSSREGRQFLREQRAAGQEQVRQLIKEGKL